MGHPPVSVRHTLCPSKGVKGQALADFLAAHLILEGSKRREDISDEICESNMISVDECDRYSLMEYQEQAPKVR